MISNGLSSLRPEGIERGPDYHTLKDEIFHQIWVNCLPPNVIALTVRALKGGTEMVPWPGLFETNFIFDLSQSSPIKVTRHLDFELIERVCRKT